MAFHRGLKSQYILVLLSSHLRFWRMAQSLPRILSFHVFLNRLNVLDEALFGTSILNNIHNPMLMWKNQVAKARRHIIELKRSRYSRLRWSAFLLVFPFINVATILVTCSSYWLLEDEDSCAFTCSRYVITICKICCWFA